tara:strand:- start:613 stop:3951 length:3339 start_codon:yes stop_codon:yes gene_type:complete
MITFSPIQKLIQETLFQKMRMLDKTPPIEINQSASKDGGGPQQNYMFARSVFLRMTSLLTRGKKPIVLMGGENDNGKMRKSLEVYGYKSGGIDENNPNVRPMAGIKDVNVEYAGGGMKLGATRKTSISWTCWTWEELQKYKPFFLKHGRVILIEFGWGFKGPDAPTFLPIIKENGEINEDLIKGDGNKKPLQERIPEWILQQKGHYDALLGTIQNFEFSVNENGGFDCTTDLVSLGVNTLSRMDSKESVAGHIANLPILQPVRKGMWWWKSEDFLANQELDKNPYYSFKSYMATLEGHLHLNSKNSKGSIAYILGNDEPYCTWGWFEDNVLSRFAGQINKDTDKVVSEFRSIESVYDDDGNIIDSKPVMMRVSRDLMPVDFSPKGWFWIYPENVTSGEDFWKNKNLTEDKSFLLPNSSVYTHKTQSGGTSYYGGGYTTSTVHKIGDFKLMFGPPYVQKEDGSTSNGYKGTKSSVEAWKSSFLGSPNADWPDNEGSHFRAFKNDWSPHGVIRNIYFGHEFLSECFDGATIKEGVDAVWSKFSEAYGGIYDFGIEFDDKEGRLMIKDRGFATRKVANVLKNTSKNPEGEVYNNDGLFVFPIWEKTSIVKGQNLSAKLPSRMQIAAMYGNNPVELGDGLVDNLDDWGAIALGRNEQPAETDPKKKLDKQMELLDSLMGNMEHPFKRVKQPTPPATMGAQFTFGRSDADENKELLWREGTSAETTNIYEDFSKGVNAKNKDNDKFGIGINEYLEDQLKEEFKKRLLESTGLEDEEEIKKAKLQTEEVDNPGWFTGSTTITTEEKMENARIAFKEATTTANGVTGLYGNPKQNILQVIRGEFSGKITEYPTLKAEYKSIMKMALKGPKKGLLKVTDPLVPIELEIEIDGTGGIFPGNSFHSSYLPKSYMDRICFQVIGASHKIDTSGWTTTIKGQMRVATPTPVEPPPERIEDVPGFGVLKPEELEKLPEVKEIRKKEKEHKEVQKTLYGDAVTAILHNDDLPPGTDDDGVPPGIKRPPEDNDGKKSNDTKIFILQKEEDIEEQDQWMYQIGKIGDFHLDQGSPVLKEGQGMFKNIDTGTLYKPGPSGDGVRANGVPLSESEASHWSDSIVNWWNSD